MSRNPPTDIRNSSHVRSGAQVFTTGAIARMCQVAPRTVTKWCDSGKLRCYRIPGSEDRRIPRDALIRFLKENGMPLGELEAALAPPRLVVLSPEPLLCERLVEMLDQGELYTLLWGDDLFTAGRLLCEAPAACVVDFRLGRLSALHVGAYLARQDVYRIALACEDEPDLAGLRNQWSHVWQLPCDVAWLAQALRKHREETR